MKYKGFVLRRSHLLGSDFRLSKNDTFVPCKPKKEHTYYDIIDPMIGPDAKWTNFDTIKECKEYLDKFLINIGMKTNLPKEWDKLV